MSEKPPHTPGKYNSSADVLNTYETALEKAIVNNGFSFVAGERIEWLDGELPIEAKKRGYKRLDLLGRDAFGRYVLCELKFSGKGEGNKDPAKADDQLLGYEELIRAYDKWFRLHSELPHDVQFDLDDFLSRPPRLMVVADKAYWIHWKEKNARRTAKHKRMLSPDVEHYSIDITEDDLAQQKVMAGKDRRYQPKLPSRAQKWSLFKRDDYFLP